MNCTAVTCSPLFRLAEAKYSKCVSSNAQTFLYCRPSRLQRMVCCGRSRACCTECMTYELILANPKELHNLEPIRALVVTKNTFFGNFPRCVVARDRNLIPEMWLDNYISKQDSYWFFWSHLLCVTFMKSTLSSVYLNRMEPPVTSF